MRRGACRPSAMPSRSCASITGLVFNHNEAILYRVGEAVRPRALPRDPEARERRPLVHISGGWFLQPDVEPPGDRIHHPAHRGRTELLPQALRRAARPSPTISIPSATAAGSRRSSAQAGYRCTSTCARRKPDLHLPSDLYRWRGVDGSEILTYRIAVGLYHTERDNIAQRLEEGTELALRLNRDVPVFWGIGNHGGGATREDLERIDEFCIERRRRVAIVHSTPERFYPRAAAARAHRARSSKGISSASSPDATPRSLA